MMNLSKIAFLLLFVACQNNPETGSSTISYDYKNVVYDTTYFSFSHKKKIESVDMSSRLKEKASKVTKADDAYTIERIGRIKTHTSILYKAISAKPELCFSPKNCYKIHDIKDFQESIYEINFAKIDKVLDGPIKEISKTTIEELIFYSEKDAQLLLRYINTVRSIEFFWDSIDKFKSDIFREKNKLYFTTARNQIASGVSPNVSKLIKE